MSCAEPHAVLDHAIAQFLSEERVIVLAVSGGLDSMCLLHLTAAARLGGRSIVVATFDHRASSHGAEAVTLVKNTGARLGLEVVAGAACETPATEDAWRRVRWAFLRQVAAERGAVIATAHTLDDHIETVAMRALRGAGARGLAGLLAPSLGIARPFVEVSRKVIARFATEAGVKWIDDPTNQSRRYFRNRVRHDLLPAMRAVRPSLPDELLGLSRRAAGWREAVDHASQRWEMEGDPGAMVDAALLTELEPRGRLVAWQSLLARRGVVVDRRGLARLAELDGGMPTGARTPLAGGFEVVRLRGGLMVRRTPADAEGTARLGDVETVFGSWVFRMETVATPPLVTQGFSEWATWVSASAEVVVRAWGAGDRVRTSDAGETRRVARFLADAGIPGPLRRGWPVVVSDGEIVWVPGVRRPYATADRSGGPIRRLVCERINR